MELIDAIQDNSSPERPYLPYLSAVESGVIVPEDLEPQKLETPLGVLLANGRIPNEQAGLIVLSGELHVCDHTSVLDRGKDKLFLGPSSKDDINEHGEIQDSGLIVLTRPNGLLRVIGVAVDTIKSPWLVGGTQRIGGIGVKLFGLNAIDFEPVDVDSEGVLSLRRSKT